MSKRFLQLACILGLYLLLFATETTFADESIIIGNYELDMFECFSSHRPFLVAV